MIRSEKHTNYETNPPVKMRFWKGLGVPVKKIGEILCREKLTAERGQGSPHPWRRSLRFGYRTQTMGDAANQDTGPSTAQLTGGAVGFSLFACQ